MPKPYPKEFRDDVVAGRRDPKTTLKQIAADFGISESCLANWLAKADREDGIRSGRRASEEKALRGPRAEQENEVSNECRLPVPGRPGKKMIYPLVSELAADGIPVTVTCRVLKIARQPYYRWRSTRSAMRSGTTHGS